MWHHQIWGQYAGYAAGYAASSVLVYKKSLQDVTKFVGKFLLKAQ